MATDSVEQAVPGQSKHFYGYSIVIAATFVMIASMGSYYTFGVFLKPVIDDFGWSRALASGAFSVSGITMGLSGVFWGKLNDQYGPRLVVTLSGVLVGLGYLLSYLMNSVWQLYFFCGVLGGVGLGGIFVPLTSTVARWFTVRRGMMMGIVVAGIGLGNLLSAPIASYLIINYRWRVSYLVIGAVTLVITLVAAQFLKRDPGQIGQAPYGAKDVKELRSNKRTVELSTHAATRTSQFWFTTGLSLCFGFCLTAVLVHLAPFATDIGISPGTAASFLSVLGVGTIIGRLAFGRIGDRIGYRSVYMLCFALTTLTMVWILFTAGVWGFYTFAMVFGIAYGGCAMAQPLLAAELFGMKSHGVILGVIGLGFSLGCAIGPFALGYIFDISHHYQLGFIISGIIAVLGLVLTALVRPTRYRSGKA